MKILYQNVDIIKKSVLNLKKLKVHYKKYDGEVSERIIRTYGEVVKNFEWYVIAFCEFKNEIRIFKCSRIENIEVLDEIFRVAENFHLEEFWRNSTQCLKEMVNCNLHCKVIKKYILSDYSTF
ncbi:helix-turn-helix transcriptional regulator [Clostridium tagluense]|uniref:helix-turn-helix transcriptional regulator n=1 Tax=Clostridium tagluense TaxID=360422 RepID=UPI002161CEFC|nr:WYL domain-containing protein [Clostridium tagluense]